MITSILLNHFLLAVTLLMTSKHCYIWGEQFTCAGEFCFFWYSVSGVNEADLGMALGESEQSFLDVASALSATAVCDGEALQKHKKQTNGNWAVFHDNSCSLLEIRMWLHTDRHISCISFTVWQRNNKEVHLATFDNFLVHTTNSFNVVKLTGIPVFVFLPFCFLSAFPLIPGRVGSATRWSSNRRAWLEEIILKNASASAPVTES